VPFVGHVSDLGSDWALKVGWLLGGLMYLIGRFEKEVGP
jgi:hypothetical protein